MTNSILRILCGLVIFVASIWLGTKINDDYQKSICNTISVIEKTNGLVEDLKTQQETFPEVAKSARNAIRQTQTSIEVVKKSQSEIFDNALVTASMLENEADAIDKIGYNFRVTVSGLVKTMDSIGGFLADENATHQILLMSKNDLKPLPETLRDTGKCLKGLAERTAHYPLDWVQETRPALYEIDESLHGIANLVERTRHILEKEIPRIRKRKDLLRKNIQDVKKTLDQINRVFEVEIPEVTKQLRSYARTLRKNAPKLKTQLSETFNSYDSSLDALDKQIMVFENGALQQAPTLIGAVQNQLNAVVELLEPARQWLHIIAWILGFTGVATFFGGAYHLVGLFQGGPFGSGWVGVDSQSNNHRIN